MITILGTATLDIILKSKKIEKIKEDSKIDIDETFFSLGGGALNAATTFKNLNLDYQAYFRLGNDLIGKIILQKIKKEKINSKIFFHKGNSQFSIVFLNKEGKRTIFVYRGVSDHFSFDELNKIKINDYFYLTTANTPPDIFKKFLERIRAKAKLIAINPSKTFLEKKESIKALRLVDILFLNDEEAKILVEKEKAEDLVIELYKTLNIPIIVITLGEKGSITLLNGAKIFKAGIFKPQKFVDTTGTGDAFASAFFANLVLSKEINEEVIKKSIIWGSANASANIEKLGAQIGLLKRKEYKKYSDLKITINNIKLQR